MTHSIREATRDDLPALRAIQLATLAEPWPELLGVAVEGPPIALVCDGAEPTGYALALSAGGPSADADSVAPSAPATLAGERSALLVELAVAAPRQGEGRGSALLSALVDRLRTSGHDRLTATVRATDRRVLAFYRARGFDRVERLSGHFESGDGHLLVRRL